MRRLQTSCIYMLMNARIYDVQRQDRHLHIAIGCRSPINRTLIANTPQTKVRKKTRADTHRAHRFPYVLIAGPAPGNDGNDATHIV